MTDKMTIEDEMERFDIPFNTRVWLSVGFKRGYESRDAEVALIKSEVAELKKKISEYEKGIVCKYGDTDVLVYGEESK